MAWKKSNESDIQVDKENKPPIDFKTCKKLFSNINFRLKNQTVGLSLEEQANLVAALCQHLDCTYKITGMDRCPFNAEGLWQCCLETESKDWLEYLKNRQIPVDNPAK